MVRRPIEIQIVREFAYSLDRAYAWLTDFQDEDSTIAGAVVKRRKIVAREQNRIVYEGTTQALGRSARGVTEVTLRPPARWEARVIEGSRLGSTTDYVMETTPRGCRLTITYRFIFVEGHTHVLARILKPLLRRELERMWDGYERAMNADLRTPA